MEEHYTSTWWRPVNGKLYWSSGELSSLGVDDRKPEAHILVYGEQTRVSYNPLVDYPGLYLDFIRLPLGHDSLERIADFANRYGPLGADLRRHVLLPDSDILQDGELRNDWLREIDDLRVAVNLWQLVRREKTEELRRHIKWTANAVSYRSSTRSTVICGDSVRPEVYATIKKRGFLWQQSHSNSMVPAMLYVQSVINRSLFKRSRIFMFSSPGNLTKLTSVAHQRG